MTKEEHTELKLKMQKAAGEETIDRVMKEFGLDAIIGTMESEIVGLASLAGKFVTTAAEDCRCLPLRRISMRDDAAWRL
jgi:hypothetical protein